MDPVLYMAPILGVTNSVYRNVYAKYFSGYDIAVTPFIMTRDSSRGMLKDKYLKDILPDRNNVPFDIVPQILSKNSSDFIVLAQAMYDLGYETINWNLGCPLPKVRNKMRGSGLLAFPDVVEGFLEDVLSKIPNKVSIKIRLGSECKHDVEDLLPRVNAFPLEEIIIHPRTGKQMYEGDVDLKAFEKCLALTRHTIVYNGDINSKEFYEGLKKRFSGISRWMFGRGGVGNPFLAEDIKGVGSDTLSVKKDRFYAFHQELVALYEQELYGPRHIVDKLKEIWFYWHKSFEGGDQFYYKICRINTVEKYKVAVDRFFQQEARMIV